MTRMLSLMLAGLVLAGCTLSQADSALTLGIEKKQQQSDIEARAVANAPCIMTIGAFNRIADPQKQCAIMVLCGGTCPQLGAPPAAVFNIGPGSE